MGFFQGPIDTAPNVEGYVPLTGNNAPAPAPKNGGPLLASVSIFKQVGAIAIIWAVLAVGADSQDFGPISAAFAVTIAGTVLLKQGPAAITALKGMTSL